MLAVQDPKKEDKPITEERRAIGGRLRKARKNAGYTVERVGEITGFSRQAVTYWEMGRNFPDPETLVKLATLYGITVDYLIGLEEEPMDELLKQLHLSTRSAARDLPEEDIKEILNYIRYITIRRLQDLG